jgi:hypothetical protein
MALTKATQNEVEGIVSTGSTGVSAGSFQVGQQYKITSLGTTTQSQWNTIAGTTGQTYVVGSLFTAATIGSGSGNGAAAVARTLANRFADVVNVKDFGAVGDGVADDTAAIQAAIDFTASRNGGYVNIPSGTYKVTSPIEITSSNIKIEGEGGDFLHDGGTGALPATKIVYNGLVSAASLFHIYTPIGASNAKRCGSGIRNVFIECNDKIAGAIHIESVNGGNFENITIYNPTFVGVLISNWNAGSIAEAADSQQNIFINIAIRLFIPTRPNVNGFILDGGPAGPGLAFANTSFNSFQYCTVQCRDGSAYLLLDADNNNFNQCRAFVVGTGKGLDIRGADSNYFYGFSCGGFPSKLWVRGIASGFFANPINNCFIYPDQGNGTTYPNLDANCKVSWIGQTGVTVKDRSQQQVISNSETNANNLIDSIGNVSLLIDNASQNALRFTNNGNANPYWGINYSGVDLRINTTEPTGEINLGNGAKTKSGTIYPSVDNSFTLGTTTGGNKVWSNIYSQNPVTVVSDERQKKEISPSVLGLDFIKSLNPVSYKFKVGQKNITKYDENLNPIEFEEIEGTRTHFGLLSQEVKAALPEGVDFGGWVLTDKENPDSQQALRYDQFIAPLIKAVQELSQENALLKQRIEALESK